MNPAEIFSRAALCAAIQQGARVHYRFFWGHTPKTPGTLDGSCLSNWFPAAIALAGVSYPTTEHYLMAAKAQLFGDHRTYAAILAAPTPKAAKALGRQVAHFDDTRWRAHREVIMETANRAKFAQHPALGAFLQQTGDAVLVEASPNDRIWGIGLAQHHPDAQHPERWPGLNLLGFGLMRVRQSLRDP